MKRRLLNPNPSTNGTIGFGELICIATALFGTLKVPNRH